MKLTLEDLKPRRTAADGAEHMAIIGTTGTGKSTVARIVLPRSGALAIIDPKRDFKYEKVDPSLPIFNTAAAIWKKKPSRFVYRPAPLLLGNTKEMDEVFRYCFEHKNITVYIDDAVGIINPHKPPHFLICCYTMGRTLGINMISCFQRPSSLPLVMTTEATKYAIFLLSEEVDIRRVRSYCIGYDPEELEDYHMFAFYDKKRKMRRCEYTVLNLRK